MSKLNDANAIYYGASKAQKVYAGAALAWPPLVGVGFPMHLFTAAGAEIFDPGNPANRDVASTGVKPVYGGPVGEIVAEATAASPNMSQSILGARPLLKRISDRDCVQFDGVDDTLWAPLNLSSAFATVPKALTLFVSVYLHTAVSGQTGFALEGATANTNSRHLLTTSASGCRTGLRFGTTAIANNVIWEDAATLGTWMDLFWELDVQQMQVAGVGTGAGTIKSWLNEEALLSTAIVPNRTATASSATFNLLSLGGSRSAGVTPAEWCACTIGKSGFARRALTGDERAQIKAWMRSPAYAPPILSLITSYTPGTDRNDFDGEVGVRLGIGAAPVTFNWMGLRHHKTGDSGPRKVTLYEWFSGAAVCSTTINLTGKEAGVYEWVRVPTTTMAANGYYALMMEVTAGMQPWANPGPITMKPAIVNIYDSYRVGAGGALSTGGQNTSFIGLDLGSGG